ncbi:MAG: hypothetical protein KA792_09145, partial [Bacteroidales bacterium]|nr:hypothetical protein [Bacteroidales bacterium]
FYNIQINNNSFTVEFIYDNYAQTKSLDGKYVIITNVEKERLLKEQVREEYKNLKHIEHSFRDLKTSELSVRPIFHINANTT